MEPKTIQAGDSITWTVTEPDYLPVDGWELTYSLVNQQRHIAISSIDNGLGGFEVANAAAVTRLWAPGVYDYRRYVSLGVDRFTTKSGSIEILTDLAVQLSGFDSGTDAQKYLASLKAARQRLAGNAHRVTVSSEGTSGRSRSYKNLDELDTAIRRAERDVIVEERARRAKAGLGHSGNIRVRL